MNNFSNFGLRILSATEVRERDVYSDIHEKLVPLFDDETLRQRVEVRAHINPVHIEAVNDKRQVVRIKVYRNGRGGLSFRRSCMIRGKMR